MGTETGSLSVRPPAPGNGRAAPTRRPSLLSASLILISAFVASRLLGLVRTSVIAASFGNGPAANAFQAAFAVPDFIFNLVVGGALNSAFIPIFAGLLAEGEEDDAWRLASTVLNAVVLLLAALGGLAALFAPALAPLLAPGFDPSTQQLVAELTRILFLQPVFFGAGAVAFAILNARQHFLFPAWAPSVYNLFQILALWLLVPSMGVAGLAVGVIVGAVAYAAMQVPALRRHGFRYRPRLDTGEASFRRVLQLLVPRTLTLASTQVGHTFTTRTLASAIVGGVSALGYAYTLLLLPVGILGVSVATAAFPTLSELVARGDLDAVRSTLRTGLRGLLYLGVGCTALLVALRLPLIGLLYQHGAFRTSDAMLTSGALLFYAIGLFAHLADELLPRAFFALRDTRTPLATTVAAVVANVALSLLLVPRMGIDGIALGLTAAACLEMALLIGFLQRKLPAMWDRSFGRDLAVYASAALPAWLAATVVAAFIALWPIRPFWQNLLSLTLGGVAGGLVYVGAAALLGCREHERALALVKALARRTRAR